MMTIAEKRKKEIYKLAEMKKNPTTATQDIAEAQKIMNSFYRLCGLCETNLYLANDERTCNTKRTAKSEERELTWFNRLNKQFVEIYGIKMFYFGYCPSIMNFDKNDESKPTSVLVSSVLSEELPPHAVIEATIVPTINNEIIFFFINLTLLKILL